jgi:hypothetical protein
MAKLLRRACQLKLPPAAGFQLCEPGSGVDPV